MNAIQRIERVEEDNPFAKFVGMSLEELDRLLEGTADAAQAADGEAAAEIVKTTRGAFRRKNSNLSKGENECQK